MSKARKKFQKVQAYGYIATTQQGALTAGAIMRHPDGDFPTLFIKPGNASLRGIARRVLVTVELDEPRACEGEEGGTQG